MASPLLRLSAIAFVLALGATPLAARASSCQIVDLETPLEQLARQVAARTDAEQIAAYRLDLIAPHASLYQPEVLGDFTPGAMDPALLRSMKDARDNASRAATRDDVRASLAEVENRFEMAFPDFRCDFPIYLMDTLGRMDGAGRQVAGRGSLVLGVDVINGEVPGPARRVLLTHELFHRYHSQAAGFSDDPGDKQAIWRSLWAEGLATYVSWKLTP